MKGLPAIVPEKFSGEYLEKCICSSDEGVIGSNFHLGILISKQQDGATNLPEFAGFTCEREGLPKGKVKICLSINF